MDYDAFRKLDNDELVHLATRGTKEEAEQLIESLKSEWPGVYIIRKADSASSEPRR